MVRQTTSTMAIEDGLDDLPARIDRGERVSLTRGGRHVANVVPEVEPEVDPPARRTDEEVQAIMNKIDLLGRQIAERLEREGQLPITIEEIIAAKHEGHRY